MPKFYKNANNDSYSLRGPARPGCLLFAEGDAEALFLEKWLSTINSNPDDIGVVCYRGGKDKLNVTFKVLSGDENFSNVKRFGFFMDAEDAPATRKSDIVTTLLRKHHVIPRESRVRAGELLVIEDRRIALFVSPDNANAGFIEQIVMNEISTDKFHPCIDEFRQCVEGVSGAPVNAKSLVQAYLGANDPRLCGTGRGFESGILKVMHEAYAGVRNTLGAVI